MPNQTQRRQRQHQHQQPLVAPRQVSLQRCRHSRRQRPELVTPPTLPPQRHLLQPPRPYLQRPLPLNRPLNRTEQMMQAHRFGNCHSRPKTEPPRRPTSSPRPRRFTKPGAGMDLGHACQRLQLRPKLRRRQSKEGRLSRGKRRTSASMRRGRPRMLPALTERTSLRAHCRALQRMERVAAEPRRHPRPRHSKIPQQMYRRICPSRARAMGL